MKTGMQTHASRLADASAQFAPRSAQLSEQLARLRLSEDDPETALRIIEACSDMTASLRLVRAVCLWLVGDRIESHLDLHQWATKSSAPLDARLLLALIEMQLGDVDRSTDLLQKNLRSFEDPRTVEALILVYLLTGRHEQAQLWAQRLRCASPKGAAVVEADPLLQSLGMPGLSALAQPTENHIADLALELIFVEPAIAALVAAQEIQQDWQTIQTLARAIERALPDLSDISTGMYAMAKLSLLQDKPVDARRWAESGLAENPMSAPLAILIQEFSLAETDDSSIPPREQAA